MTATPIGGEGAPGAVALPSQRSLLHPTHPAFLPSDQWSRTADLCHSILIHLSSLVRLMPSMATSISSAQDATAACLSTSTFIPLHLDALAEALLLPFNDPAAPRAAKALLRGRHQPVAPHTSSHFHRLLRSASPRSGYGRPGQGWSTAACRLPGSPHGRLPRVRCLWGPSLLPSRSPRHGSGSGSPRRTVHNDGHAHRRGRGTRCRGRLSHHNACSATPPTPPFCLQTSDLVQPALCHSRLIHLSSAGTRLVAGPFTPHPCQTQLCRTA